MSSVFKKTGEEVRKREIESVDFTTLLERQTKKFNLEEDLELLLYDVNDAIKENQILLVDTKEEREVAYLIPLLLAYQNTTFFDRFIIATASSVTRKRIIKRINELSSILGINIPVHVLENERNYVCLKRLKGYNKKRRNQISNPHQESMKKREWRKIQVRNCTLSSCQFFKSCKFALAYSSINRKGCSIITHAHLVSQRKAAFSFPISSSSDIIVIDEAEKFANNIRDSYQQLISYDYICNCFSRAKQLLNRAEYSYITNENFNTLQHFFEELAQCERGFNWQITDKLKQYSSQLASTTRRILIHLTRQYAVKVFSRETEQLCDRILIIGKFFQDVSESNKRFQCQLQERERSENTKEFRKVQVFYYPKQVDTIISSTFKSESCSIVLTGKGIAGQDGSYQELSQECGLENIDKPKVKEYVLK